MHWTEISLTLKVDENSLSFWLCAWCLRTWALNVIVPILSARSFLRKPGAKLVSRKTKTGLIRILSTELGLTQELATVASPLALDLLRYSYFHLKSTRTLESITKINFFLCNHNSSDVSLHVSLPKQKSIAITFDLITKRCRPRELRFSEFLLVEDRRLHSVTTRMSDEFSV